ncbi:J domain-containing protein [Hymenobacter taeanensis]|uniref:J domain-containing protein n=1 Tax=Hymenobacter taeanensis TaxID=2735321 RepID=A0A6M6BCU1_9BACT|nr:MULTISPECIES: J domain-containing protein [Hymenobacter]QJX46301.1 J domain-containing protein [Hymenobacter taeanensis]UOQ80159.1 J domain-containing protein [Hymenobacter sp. 5414T-23]
MSTLYTLLEVSEQASAEDLRRAYRRLVLLTHPDRTPDPAAHQRYLIVNEAYDILSNPIRRRAYDALLQTQRQPPEPPRPLHRDPALRRRGRPPAPRRAPTTEERYGQYAPYAHWVCRVALLLVALMVLDFLWVEHLPNEVVENVESVSLYARGYNMGTHSNIQTTHAYFRSDTDSWPEGTHLMVDRTMLFGVFRRAAPVGHPELLMDAGGVTIYDNFIFLPLLLALLAGLGLWRAPAMRSINCAVACAFLLPIVLYIMLVT